VLDILNLQERYGDAIIYLCGNHELPHLDGFVLSKGSTVSTPGFEAALSQSGCRDKVLELFEVLPFFIRTAAGVSIAHAGASAPLVNRAQATSLFDWDHQALRAWAEERLAEGDRAELRSGYARLSGESSYDAMAQHYLAVSGSADPRYDDLLRGFFVTAHPDFRIIRSALFTRCEQEDSEASYTTRLVAALEQLSVGYAPQHLLMAGHMATSGGHTIVAQRHLRLASGAHAHPAASRAYLLFDAARSIESIDALSAGLQPLA
jgi:hypothetical protein